METNTWWETTKVQGGELVDRVRQLVREGNVRRIVIKQGDRSVAEFPLAAGVVGVFFAPMLAAVGALAALLTDCSIAVEREVTAEPAAEPPAEASPAAAPAPEAAQAAADEAA